MIHACLPAYHVAVPRSGYLGISACMSQVGQYTARHSGTGCTEPSRRPARTQNRHREHVQASYSSVLPWHAHAHARSPVPPREMRAAERTVSHINQQIGPDGGWHSLLVSMTSITSQRRTAGFDRHGVQLVIRSSSPEWHICSGGWFLVCLYLYRRPWREA